jgi:hypothetical protein
MNTRGFDSTWLPEQQEHAVGRKAHFDPLRGDLHRGAMWTDDDSKAGDLLFTKWQELPSGLYTAVLQVWDRRDSGETAGTFLAESPDGILAHNPVLSRDNDFGDWQREAVSFRLDAPTKVRLRFQYNGSIPIWTGSLHLSRSGQRPIYIIGHNRNTTEAVDRSLSLGANAIEGDFSYRDGKLLVAETPPYPGWRETSQPAEWFSHLKAREKDWAFIYLDCKPNNVPNNDFRHFGKVLCELIRNAGIAPERCLFSVGDGRYTDLHRALGENGFSNAPIGMDGVNDSNPEHSTPETWPQAALDHRIQSLGMGRASLEITKPLAHWLAPLQACIAARDAGKPYPKKVIFWTLEQKDGMRKVLDLGVDGVIAEHEDRLCEVLLEEPYRRFCRRAEPREWNLFQAHGIDSGKSAQGQ